MRTRTRKVKLLVVGMVAVALATGVAGATSARDQIDVVLDCTRLGYSFQSCCVFAGGEYHAKQESWGLHEWCTWGGSSSEPDGQQPPTRDSRVGSTSGSFNQPVSPTPTPTPAPAATSYGGPGPAASNSR